MRLTWNSALEETEMVLFETVHKLFKATGVQPQEARCPSCCLFRLLPQSSACMLCTRPCCCSTCKKLAGQGEDLRMLCMLCMLCSCRSTTWLVWLC